MLILIAVGFKIRPSGSHLRGAAAPDNRQTMNVSMSAYMMPSALFLPEKERQEKSVFPPRKRHFLAKFFSRKHKDEIGLTEAEALRVARAFGLEDTVRMSMRYVSPLNALYDWDLVDYDVLREMVTEA